MKYFKGVVNMIRFYQTYIIDNVEELCVILSSHILSKECQDMDLGMALYYTFISEEDFSQNNKTSKFVVSSKLYNKFYRLIDRYKTVQCFIKSIDQAGRKHKIIRSLYDSMINNKTMGRCYNEDTLFFGKENTDWYINELLFGIFLWLDKDRRGYAY